MSFGSLSKVKAILGIPDPVTKQDAAIQCAVDAANGQLLAFFCLDQCEPKAYELEADLDCSGRRLPNVRSEVYPLISIDAATLFGSALTLPDAVRIRGFDIVRFCGSSCRCARSCGTGCADLTLTVTAGFDAADPKQAPALAALQYGAAKLAAAMYQGGPSGGLKREQVGRYSWEAFSPAEMSTGWGPGSWPVDLQNAIAPFVRPMAMTTATRVC